MGKPGLLRLFGQVEGECVMEDDPVPGRKDGCSEPIEEPAPIRLGNDYMVTVRAAESHIFIGGKLPLTVELTLFKLHIPVIRCIGIGESSMRIRGFRLEVGRIHRLNAVVERFV